MVVVRLAWNVIVFGAFIVIVLNVKFADALLKIMAPVPPPVSVKLLNTLLTLDKRSVLVLADASVIDIVEPSQLTVVLLSLKKSHIIPVNVTVHVSLPIVRVLDKEVVALEVTKFLMFTLKLLASNSPLYKVIPPVAENASYAVRDPPALSRYTALAKF